jgi:MoxR-like ATPase
MERLTPEEAVATRDGLRRALAQVERVIVGKRDVIELCLMSLLARGHVLIEDVPGVGKTMLAKALARSLGASFKRIQFTPDLLPGDVTGLSIYNPKAAEFFFSAGPVFTHILLADEINRATPKTQSALLEAMEESQVTIDGQTRPLPQPFFVLATQNPVEYRGTYPLPEAQMDRFLLRLSLGYPGKQEEVDMVLRHVEAGASAPDERADLGQANVLLSNVEPVLSVETLRLYQRNRMRVHISPTLAAYIVDVAHATRSHVQVALGASPRAALALQRAAQASAIMAGREYATPDDVKKLAPMTLSHRLILHGDTGDGRGPEQVVHQVLAEVPVRG